MSRLQGDTPGAARVATPESRAARILERLDELFEIGRAAGTNRLGFDAGEERAHELVLGWMREAGLETARDPAANTVGRLAGSEPDLPEVWSGSHLDTPPDGGRFDGALGVLLALDAAEAIAAGGQPRRTIKVIACRLEEGPRFGRGVFGSRAICGRLEDDEGDLVDSDGISLARGVRRARLRRAPAGRVARAAARLLPRGAHRAGPDAGGRRAAARRRQLDRRHGRPGVHVPRPARARGHRADAAPLGRARRRRALRRRRARRGPLASRRGRHDRSPDRRAGRDEHDPRALRACSPTCGRPTTRGSTALVEGAVAAAREAARGANCKVTIEPRWRYEAVAMSEEPRGALSRAVAALGLEPFELPSGAGHDAGIFALAGVPSAMLFVRSDAGGVSHAPEEHTGADAVVLAVQAFEAAVRELAGA